MTPLLQIRKESVKSRETLTSRYRSWRNYLKICFDFFLTLLKLLKTHIKKSGASIDPKQLVRLLISY